jgi:predicted transcriptional regulator
MKMFTTLLDEDLHKKLKEISEKEGKKIKKLIEEAIKDLIIKYGESK